MNWLIRLVQGLEQSGLKLVVDKVGFGVLRHLMTVGGGYFISQGVMDRSELETAIAAVITLIGVAWSVMSKLSAKAQGTQTTVPPGQIAGILLISVCVLASGCVSSTLEQVRRHDAKIISARVTAANGAPQVMVGVDLLALADTGWWAALKEDTASMLGAMGWDAAKSAMAGAALYYSGKQAGLWGKDSSSDPAQPTYQINGNSGTVNIAGNDNNSNQTTSGGGQ